MFALHKSSAGLYNMCLPYPDECRLIANFAANFT